MSRGYTDQKRIDVRVVKPTTTTYTTESSTSTETTTVPTTTTQSSTTTSSSTTETVTEDLANIDEDLISPDESHNNIDYDDTKDEVEALPVSDREALEPETSGSVGVIAGVIVTLVVLIIVLTMAVITWHRRRKSHLAIISYLQTVMTVNIYHETNHS